MELSLEHSRTLTSNTLMNMAEATTQEGKLLDPNGVIDALISFYVMVWESAGWSGDPVEDVAYWVQEYLLEREEYENAERLLGERDQEGSDGSVPYSNG